MLTSLANFLKIFNKLTKLVGLAQPNNGMITFVSLCSNRLKRAALTNNKKAALLYGNGNRNKKD